MITAYGKQEIKIIKFQCGGKILSLHDGNFPEGCWAVISGAMQEEIDFALAQQKKIDALEMEISALNSHAEDDATE